jgi:hypothetical protein
MCAAWHEKVMRLGLGRHMVSPRSRMSTSGPFGAIFTQISGVSANGRGRAVDCPG